MLKARVCDVCGPEVEVLQPGQVLEMRHATGLPRGVARPLYEAAREAQGGEPLVFLAAERLLGYSSNAALGQFCNHILRSDRCQAGCPLARTIEARAGGSS